MIDNSAGSSGAAASINAHDKTAASFLFFKGMIDSVRVRFLQIV